MGSDRVLAVLNGQPGLCSGIAVSVEVVARWYRFEFDDFNTIGEAIRVVEEDFTYRIASNVTYNLNEKVNVNFSFGKGFTDKTIASSGFFSIIGINYNLFSKTNKLKKG